MTAILDGCTEGVACKGEMGWLLSGFWDDCCLRLGKGMVVICMGFWDVCYLHGVLRAGL